jgi:hypothetical protein
MYLHEAMRRATATWYKRFSCTKRYFEDGPVLGSGALAHNLLSNSPVGDTKWNLPVVFMIYGDHGPWYAYCVLIRALRCNPIRLATGFGIPQTYQRPSSYNTHHL